MNRHDTTLFGQRALPGAGPMAEHNEGALVTLAGAAGAARRCVVPLAIWLMLCLAAAAWYLHVTPPSYTASATVLLDPKRPATQVGDTSATVLPPALDAAAAESQIQVIRSERLLYSVFDALNLSSDPTFRPGPLSFSGRIFNWIAALFRKPSAVGEDKAALDAAAFDAFTGRVGARRVGQSYVMEVSYTSGNPSVARRLANAIVSAYLGQQVSFKLAAAQNGAEYLQGRVNALGNEVKAATAGMLAGTVPASLLPDADARIIGAALEPLGRSAPKTGLVVAFAAAFGLLSGLFSVAVLSGLDRRVRSADQLERTTGLPCLGTIPDARRKGLGRRPFAEMVRLARRDPDGKFAVAMRDARTSILLALAGKPGHALGIISWAGGAGCSLVAANLAQVVAMSGSHVTLVDADIHRAEGGLTALADSVAVGLTESLLDQAGTTASDAVMFDGNVTLVPARAGRGARSYEAYLGAPGLLRLVEEWQTQGDVIVDLPALASGGDSRAAAAHLDGVAIVVEAGRTTTDDVERALKVLSRAGATVVGTILNRARVR